MPSRPLLTLAPFVVAGSLLLLASCSDGGDGDSSAEDASDEATELEDAADEQAEVLATTTTVPPPATQATAPRTTRDPNAPRPTTTIPDVSSSIAEAPPDAVLGVVGTAAWDTGLPIPSDCIATASFTPSGEGGANGGVITCVVGASSDSVDQFFQLALARGQFPFADSGGGSGFRFTIADAATIAGSSASDGGSTSLSIEQRFP